MGGFANLMLMERFSHKIDFAVFVSALLTPSGTAYLHDTPLLKLVHTGITPSIISSIILLYLFRQLRRHFQLSRIL